MDKERSGWCIDLGKKGEKGREEGTVSFDSPSFLLLFSLPEPTSRDIRDLLRLPIIRSEHQHRKIYSTSSLSLLEKRFGDFKEDEDRFLGMSVRDQSSRCRSSLLVSRVRVGFHKGEEGREDERGVGGEGAGSHG